MSLFDTVLGSRDKHWISLYFHGNYTAAGKTDKNQMNEPDSFKWPWLYSGFVGGEGASHPPSKPAFRHTPVSVSQIWPINSAPQPCEWQGCYSWTICLYRGIGVEKSAGSSGLGQLGCVQRPKPSLAMRAVLSLPSTGSSAAPDTGPHLGLGFWSHGAVTLCPIN